MGQNCRIAIVGYGKMGKEIELQAKALQVPVSRVVSRKDDLGEIQFQPDEVAIEFTSPESCFLNVTTLLQKGVPVLCGTTGWIARLPEIRTLVEKRGGTFLYGSNFSTGVHLFWRAVNHLAKSINSLPQYNVSASETHHVHKKDAPSGTAKTTADIVVKNIDRISKLEFDCYREGEVFGNHHVYFQSPDDTIEISHKAKNRSAFAKGAVECAVWLKLKKGFFTVEDYMKEVLE